MSADDVLATGSVDDPDDEWGRDAVIAAVDGAPADTAVVDWAAAEAARTGRALRLVTVIEPSVQLSPYNGAFVQLPTLVNDLAVTGRAILDGAADRARAIDGDLDVATAVIVGAPAAALVELSRLAAFVVVGGPPRRRLERAFLGSVALATVAHATCPVVVVPDGAQVTAPRRVVVGIDGSEVSARAAEVAFATAAAAGGTVTAVVGWNLEVVDGYVVTEPGSERWAQVESRYSGMVHTVVDPLRARHPGVEVSVEVRHDRPASAVVLTAEQTGADLVVIGSRGRGGFTGLLLGSVSRKVVETTHTVVAVVH